MKTQISNLRIACVALCALLAISILTAHSTLAATVAGWRHASSLPVPYELIVVDVGYDCSGTERLDGVFRVNMSTGMRRPISTGGQFCCPSGLALDVDGTILVADQLALGGAVFRVDPVTGAQTVISSGGHLALPWRVMVHPNGHLITSNFGFDDSSGAIIGIDPITGEQTVISAGGLLGDSAGIALAHDGSIYVANFRNPELVRIDPKTGEQEVIASGGTLRDAIDMVIEADGNLLVLSATFGVTRVNPITRAQTQISDIAGEGLALAPTGEILVVNRWLPGGPFARIDAATGASALLTSPEFINPFGCCVVAASTHYVSQDSPAPIPPYATWSTAAHTIQDAVDAAQPGDIVLVTNGVYATGGRARDDGILMNRVVIDRPVTVRSVNGPALTIIVGAAAPGGGNGDGAIRCAYVGEGAVLSGFTLTNGHTRWLPGDWWLWDSTEECFGGGVTAALSSDPDLPGGVVSNCVITGNSAAWGGGGAYGGTLHHCSLTGNSAEDGGGANQSTLFHCALVGNSAQSGGGSYLSTLENCSLSNNRADSAGGGCLGGTLANCVLTGNTAGDNGGGANYSTLNNCTLTGNVAGKRGGGIYNSQLYNSIVYYNGAPVGSNWYWDSWYPEAFETLIGYSCTVPLPDYGEGNIAAEPQLASASHLSATSPCLGAGSAVYSTGVDIDGEPWATPPCMGADQLVAGNAKGLLSVAIEAEYITVVAGFGVAFTARIEGQTTGSRWDLGDGTLATNQPYVASHTWNTVGTYTVRLTAFNEAYPAGISATTMVEVVELPVFYVNQANPSPVFPYTSWETAATNIQDAIGASPVAGRLVWVTNGVYAGGGVPVWSLMTNRVALINAVTVQSVNGPAITIIQGAAAPGGANGEGAVRCAYVGHRSVLSGFTLTNGHTRITGDTGRDRSGAGAWCESGGILTNCVLTGNHAARDGGGADGGTLFHCTISGNTAEDDGGGTDDSVLYDCTLAGNVALDTGGGADEGVLYNCLITGNSARSAGGVDDSTLYNCTIAGNSASGNAGGTSQGTLYNCVVTGNEAGTYGGGAYQGILYNCTVTGNKAGRRSGGVERGELYNCIVYYNQAPLGANWFKSVMDYCCTVPRPDAGEGNIVQDPQLASATHLSAASPCIGAGSATYSTGVDIDGERWWAPPCMGADQFVAGNAVGPLSAYEFQTPASLISYAWLQQFGLPTDGTADTTDPDGDHLNNWQEWRSGTDPTNALSVLRLLPPLPAGNDVNVRWQSVAGVNYFLERSTNLTASPPFLPIATNLPGQAGTTIFTDINAAGAPPRFYRVGVSIP